MHVVLPQILREKMEYIAKLEGDLADITKQLNESNRKVKFWMNQAQDIEFNARIAKGCYRLCPIGKIPE